MDAISSHGAQIQGADFANPSSFMGVVARWSRESIDVRSPAESRNVVGAPRSPCGFDGGSPGFLKHRLA